VFQNGSVIHFNLDRDRSVIHLKVPGEKTKCRSTSHTSQLVRKIGDQSQSKGCTCGKFSSHDDYAWVMSHMHESCHVGTCRFTYGWVISHTSESCYIQMSHVTNEWVVSHSNASCHVQMRRNATISHVNVLRYIWMSHWYVMGWLRSVASIKL